MFRSLQNQPWNMTTWRNHLSQFLPGNFSTSTWNQVYFGHRLLHRRVWWSPSRMNMKKINVSTIPGYWQRVAKWIITMVFIGQSNKTHRKSSINFYGLNVPQRTVFIVRGLALISHVLMWASNGGSCFNFLPLCILILCIPVINTIPPQEESFFL